MKLNLALMFMVLVFSFLSAQKIDIKAMQASGECLIGQAENPVFEKADKDALAYLISQISVRVEANFTDMREEANGNLNELTQRLIKTYSSSILTNASRYTEPQKKGSYKVYRYLKLAEKDKIFAERKNRVLEYVETARKNEDLNDTGLALKNYYWALILLKSLPDKNNVYYNFQNQDKLLLVFLQDKIQNVLRDITIEVSETSQGKEFSKLLLKAKNQQGIIMNLDFQYFDGEDWSSSNIKDSQGAVIIKTDYLQTVQEIMINLDYQYLKYLGETPLDEDVKLLSEYISIPFDNKKKLNMPSKKQIQIEKEIQEHKPSPAKDSVLVVSAQPDKKENNLELQDIVTQIIKAIKQEKFPPVQQFFSPTGYSQFLKIMNYGQVTLYKDNFQVHYMKVNDQTQIRSIPLLFRLDNRKTIYDNISLIYENGKIQWVNFTINDNIVDDAVKRGKLVNDFNDRMMCVSFMEYYKTIFNLKDITRINEIFSDSAVIFVGYIKRKASAEEKISDAINKQLGDERLRVNKLTKSQYLSNLENQTFRKNKFINLQFEDFELIRKNRQSSVYGIQLKQLYYSSGYSDKGYLLLLADFKDSKEPKIFFRYWQPAKASDENMERLQIGDLRF